MLPAASESTHLMSRRSALSLMVAGLGAALVSCARGSETRPAPGDVVTLVTDNATWGPGYSQAGDALHRLVGYHIRSRSVPNVSNYQQIVRMSAQTDSTSDLIKWWNGYRLQDLARAGILTDVSSAWDRAAREGWSDDAELRTSFTYEGRQYGVPLYKSYYVVLYSKKAFARLKAEVPTTWDEFVHLVEAARRAGMTPIASGGATTWESLIWFQQLVNGLDHGYYQDVTAGRASYTDPVAQQAMLLWADLYRREAFSAPDLSAGSLPGQLAKGTTVMQLYATWTVGSLLTSGLTDADLGAFLLPPPPDGAPSVVVESAGLTVAANSHKHAAAVAVADSWLDPSVQKVFSNFLKDTSADPSVVPDVGVVRDVATAVKEQQPTQATRYWEASPPALVEGNVQDLSAFMTNPTPANARSTLDSMQRRADKEWKVWNS